MLIDLCPPSFNLYAVTVKEATGSWKLLGRTRPMMHSMAQWVAGAVVAKLDEATYQNVHVRVEEVVSTPQSEEQHASDALELSLMVSHMLAS